MPVLENHLDRVRTRKGREDRLHPEDLRRLQVHLYRVSLDHVLQVAEEAVVRQDKLGRERVHQMQRDIEQH